MIELSSFKQTLLTALFDTFGERVWFVGLQGSYGRGEADESSDLDLVVILDVLSASDIAAYGRMLDTLPHRDKLCGFLAGERELFAWEPSDLLQLYYDTTPLYGTLDAVTPLLDGNALERAIRLGACNLYHGCVHNMLYERSEEALRGLYKAAVFTVQAIAFKQTGRYMRRHRELLAALSGKECAIVETALAMRKGVAVDFDAMSEQLISFASAHI